MFTVQLEKLIRLEQFTFIKVTSVYLAFSNTKRNKATIKPSILNLQ